MSFLLVEMTAILRHWSLGGEAGKSGWKPAIFINGPLLPEEEIVSFLSFLPVSPWVLQLNGITSIRISSLLSFSYHFPSPERNCWPLYPGPSLGVLTQESDTYEPRILRLRACMGSASVRTEPEVDRVYHIDPANALETKWFLDFDFIVVKIGLVEGSYMMVIKGHGLHSAGRMNDLVLLVPDCHSFNR